jgi:peroxiredoxin
MGGASEAEAQATAGDPAPAFELETVDGQLVSLGDFLGEKVVFINFVGNT